MKAKTMILALWISCAATTGFSQIRVGGKVGMNISSLKGTNSYGETSKQKVGFHAGATVEVPFGVSNFALLGELLFSTQGNISDKSYLVNDTNGFSYNEERRTFSLTYINLPIMLKYYVIPDQLSIEGGPQFGYAVKGELKTEISNTSNPNQNSTVTQDALKDGSYVNNGQTIPTQKLIKPFDAGINLGATYYFNDKLYAQLHYYFGLTDANALPASYLNNNYISTNTFRSSVFQVSLGYRFM